MLHYLIIPRFSKYFWRINEHKFVSAKKIRLHALEAIVNYHLIAISSS